MYIEERLAKMEHVISELQDEIKLLKIRGFYVDQVTSNKTVAEAHPEVFTPSKQAEQVADNTITPEEIRQLCVQLVRADPSNKAKVSTILGGKLVKELDPADYTDIVKKLNALEAK